MASSYAQTGESAGYAHTVCSAGATDAADTGISRAARPVMCSLDDGCCHGNNFLSRERAICLDHLEPPHLTPKTTREAAPPHLTPQTAREADRPLVCVLGACSPKHGRNRRQAAELRRAQLKKRLRLDLNVISRPALAARRVVRAVRARRPEAAMRRRPPEGGKGKTHDDPIAPSEEFPSLYSARVRTHDNTHADACRA